VTAQGEHATVGRKLEERLVPSPMPGWFAPPAWESARLVEVIDFTLEFKFRHSLGRCSRFFLGLEQRLLLATRCPSCGHVWMPPRPFCGNDGALTDWIELSGRGTLAAATACSYSLQGPITATAGQAEAAGQATVGSEGAPMVLGYVALEGASTLLLQRIKGHGDVKRLVAGLALAVAWADSPVDHPMELFWFEPLQPEKRGHEQGQ